MPRHPPARLLARPLALLLLSLLLPACGTPSDSAPSLVGCLVDEEVAITDMTITPSGFELSPEAALALVIGHWEGTLERHDGAAIALTLHTTATGPMLLQRRSWRAVEGPSTELASAPRTGVPGSTAPSTGPGPAGDGLDTFACEDTYALPVELDLRALPDLDVQHAFRLTVSASGAATFALRIGAAEHDGSAAPAAEDLAGPGTITAIELLVHGARGSGPWTGEVAFGIERHHAHDGGGDAAVSYSQSAYATWSAEAELTPAGRARRAGHRRAG